MTVRTILAVPAPVLRKRARNVEGITPEIRTLADDMVETMRAAPGVGLAAPQVGVGLRVIVVEYAEGSEEPRKEGEPPPKPELYILVNPEITRRSRAKVTGDEACLSVPGFSGEVERHADVVVKGHNLHGAPIRIRAKGWLARIFQHEIDHLDGVLYVDRASKMWEIKPEDIQDNV
jgi:peptide deformylase